MYKWLGVLVLLGSSPCWAHDEWADGKPIPDWVKASCCGPADAHHLKPEQVHRISADYYEVDGYHRRIPVGQALPSQDGDYWIFYRDAGDSCAPGFDQHNHPIKSCTHDNDQSSVYCFFVPMNF